MGLRPRADALPLMGWYTSEQAGDGITTAVIGWHTGWLGKAIFFLGTMLLLAALREAGIQLPASLPESLFVIAIGALATIFVVIRVISIPDEFFFASRGVGIFVALAAAITAIIAGLLAGGDVLDRGKPGFPRSPPPRIDALPARCSRRDGTRLRRSSSAQAA